MFEITLPDEYVGIPLEELKLMVTEQPQMSSAGFSAAADPFIYLEVHSSPAIKFSVWY